MNPLISIRNLKKYYSQDKQIVKAINDISLDIYRGETLGLVGESGCGKSTVARCLLRLTDPTGGTIEYEGKSITALKGKELKAFRRQAGMIFQDPYASLNPRMTAGDIIAEPLQIHNLAKGAEKKRRIRELLELVGLPNESYARYPHEFSGGQRQRIGIARAISMNPGFIICDEPISALDVSVQAQIINLLKQLQEEIGLTYLFIAHDLRIVKYLSTRVAVMYLGQIMELAPSDELYKNPQHPYTQALLSAIPIPDPKIEKARQRIVLRGEVPSPINPPKGCPFVTRCPHATPVCHHVRPEFKEISSNHFAACHLLTEFEHSTEESELIGINQNSSS
ncbi:MAG: Oligopeptide transport ATP-binding protein OppF [Chlamydiae bacterium]|nr:Oligopeptide transport ATP-binding protein OppF [Chlamydiota bacterium]